MRNLKCKIIEERKSLFGTFRWEALKSLDVVLQLNTFKNFMTFDRLRDPRVFGDEHELNAF